MSFTPKTFKEVGEELQECLRKAGEIKTGIFMYNDLLTFQSKRALTYNNIDGFILLQANYDTNMPKPEEKVAVLANNPKAPWSF